MPAAVDPEWEQWKKEINGASETVRNSGLEWLLRAAFRKRRFREAQASAIKRWVDKKDTVVLLPTGAGKSLIYQLTALISPGTTLLIAPLVALINDQSEGLEQFGIRRLRGLSSDEGGRDEEKRALEEIKLGTLIVLAMAPERLQKPEWRQALGVARDAGGISGGVIDEGHCVSECGTRLPAFVWAARQFFARKVGRCRDSGADRHGESIRLPRYGRAHRVGSKRS